MIVLNCFAGDVVTHLAVWYTNGFEHSADNAPRGTCESYSVDKSSAPAALFYDV